MEKYEEKRDRYRNIVNGFYNFEKVGEKMRSRKKRLRVRNKFPKGINATYN